MSTPRFTAAELRQSAKFVADSLSGNELVVRMCLQAAEDAERIETLETALRTFIAKLDDRLLHTREVATLRALLQPVTREGAALDATPRAQKEAEK